MRSAELLIASEDDSNMRYVTGLRIPDDFIWARIGKKQYVIVSDLEYGRAKEEARKGTAVVHWKRYYKKGVRGLAGIAAAFLKAQKVKKVVVAANCDAAYYVELKKHFSVEIRSPFFPQRIIKNKGEIAAIKATAKTTIKAFDHALKILKRSTPDKQKILLYKNRKLTAEWIKAEMEKIFLDDNCTSGETIVACGIQASQPHNRGSGYLYAHQAIVFDIFPRNIATGYYFDMSRTVCVGTPSKELQKLYDAVLKSQLAGVQAIKPNIKASVVHQACAKVFVQQGYKTTNEEGFIHSTGHGVGLDIHESPSVGERSETILKPGMIITVEPGLYYKRLGGVRIEDTLLVTKSGSVSLTPVPKVFVIRR